MSTPPLRSLSSPAVGLALCAALAACDPVNSGGPSDLPSPSPKPAAASLNMTLRSRVDLTLLSQPQSAAVEEWTDAASQSAAATSAAGNWGYTSPDGRRFALTGLNDGTSVVEVTDPGNPRRIAHIPGPNNQWREIRTYRQYVYVTTEARHGLDIIDMRDPSRPRKVQTWSQTFTSAHSLWIDEARGLLYAHGTRDAAGASSGMRVLALEPDQENPREVGAFTDFYIHDSYGRGNLLYAAAISNGFVGILDVRDPGRIRELTRFFTGGRFTHNTWLTQDGRYLFTTDERANRPVEGWDLIDMFAPRKVSEYLAAPNTIAHNVMVDGHRLLISHYTEGVRLLDVRDPERPSVLGFYDTYTGTATGFNGAWGAYIFPGTNLIVVSDISGGLFVIQYTGA